jgi:hypothetical protein
MRALQLENLHHRTEVEFLLFGSRSNSSSFMRPTSWSTSDRIEEYFQLQFKKSPGEFAGMMECFLLSGLKGEYDLGVGADCLSNVVDIGTVNVYRNNLMVLKQKVAKLIFNELCTSAQPIHNIYS